MSNTRTDLPHTSPSPDLLTARQVAERLSMSVRSIYRLVAAGKLPRPVRYTRKLVRWKTTDVSHYVEKLTG